MKGEARAHRPAVQEHAQLPGALRVRLKVHTPEGKILVLLLHEQHNLCYLARCRSMVHLSTGAIMWHHAMAPSWMEGQKGEHVQHVG